MRVSKGKVLLIFILIYLIISPIYVSAQQSPNNQDIFQHISENKLISSVYSTLVETVESEFGLFFTVSYSNGSDAYHFHIPFLLRLVKQTGIGLLLLVSYTSDSAETFIADRSGEIVDHIKGPHKIFFHGFGMFGYNGSAFNGPVWLVAVSIRPPRVLLG